MHVLIVGGSGYVGRLLLDRCLQLGWQVSVFDLTPPSRRAEAHFIRGDRNQIPDLLRSAQQYYDAVIDLIAYQDEQTKAMVQVWAGKTNRFVHLSTVAVYGSLMRDHASETEAVRISNSAPSYGAAKARCERVLEEAFESSGFPMVILRSAPLFGPADPVSRENYFLKRLLAGRPIRHPGPFANYILLLYVFDLIEAIVQAVVRDRIVGNAYHLAQGELPRLADHIQAIGRLAQVKNVALEEVALQTLYRQGFHIHAFPYSHSTDRRLSNDRAREDLGLSLTSYHDGLSKTIQWYLANGPHELPAWPGHGTTQSRLCGTHEWLHAELERQIDAGCPPIFVPDPETVLEQLTSSQRQSEWIFLRHCPPPDNRPAVDQSKHRPQRVPVALVPEFIFQMLDDKNRINYTEWEPQWQLAAVFEAIPDSSDSAVLYAQLPATFEQDYRHNQPVPVVHFLKFSQLDPASLATNVRVVVNLNDEENVVAFGAWLEQQSEGDEARIPALESYGSVFLTDFCRWLPANEESPCSCGQDGEIHRIPEYMIATHRRLREIRPWPGKWAALFEISRLLSRAGFRGSARLRISAPDAPLFNYAIKPGLKNTLQGMLPVLFSSDEHYFLWSVQERRLFEVPAELAVVIEGLRYSLEEEVIIRTIHLTFALSAERACRLVENGRSQLAKINQTIAASENPSLGSLGSPA